MTRGNAEYTIAIQRAASSYTSCYERLMPIYTLMAYFVLFGGGGGGEWCRRGSEFKHSEP